MVVAALLFKDAAPPSTPRTGRGSEAGAAGPGSFASELEREAAREQKADATGPDAPDAQEWSDALAWLAVPPVAPEAQAAAPVRAFEVGAEANGLMQVDDVLASEALLSSQPEVASEPTPPGDAAVHFAPVVAADTMAAPIAAPASDAAPTGAAAPGSPAPDVAPSAAPPARTDVRQVAASPAGLAAPAADPTAAAGASDAAADAAHDETPSAPPASEAPAAAPDAEVTPPASQEQGDAHDATDSGAHDPQASPRREGAAERIPMHELAAPGRIDGAREAASAPPPARDAAALPAAPERALARHEVAPLLEQALDGAVRLRRDGARWEARIRLDPPELGLLDVRIEAHGGRLHVVARCDDPELQQSLGQLVRDWDEELGRRGGGATFDLREEAKEEEKRSAMAPAGDRSPPAPSRAHPLAGSAPDEGRRLDLLA